jgi:hypothetical protein
MGWRTAAAALDAGTAACAAINSVYFLERLLSGADRPSRRLAVGVLAVVSFGTLIEALALVAMASGPGNLVLTASASWVIVRLLPFAGAAGLSVLVARGEVLR